MSHYLTCRFAFAPDLTNHSALTVSVILMENDSIIMKPAPGSNWVRFVGDSIRFEIEVKAGRTPTKGYRAFLRTNLGRATVLRAEILEAHSAGASPAGAAMHDIPMRPSGEGWSVELALADVGFFQAKAYLLDDQGWQHWPDGPDFGLSVHPDYTRTANTIYCAFVRLFGPAKTRTSTADPKQEAIIAGLEQSGHAVIPPSGKLRDLVRELPHIIDTLGCRVLHLLPVNPVPTTYARFGRFGSPYAALDLAAIDQSLIKFDRRTTGVDQFCELTRAVHDRNARVFLDIVINHTGWGSTLQDQHPEWFLRDQDGTFKSPGAWGNTWADLVELRQQNVALWDEISEALLTWCRRGVDGFRCDAGYMVPVHAWQYIITRVQEEFPDAVFLLEGLGGAWEATQALVTQGGMQWAYSELFQNYSGREVSHYIDHTLKKSPQVGTLVHFSETHDNNRLAVKGRNWSLVRNQLCALGSVNGAFGFTCGVEWLATEKVDVHSCNGLAWGNTENVVDQLASLNRLLTSHPCFFDGAKITRLSPANSSVLALLRVSWDEQDLALILVNLSDKQSHTLKLNTARTSKLLHAALEKLDLDKWTNLLDSALSLGLKKGKTGVALSLPAAAAFCLSPTPKPVGLCDEDYRAARARAAWGINALCRLLPAEQCGSLDWRRLASIVDDSPSAFLAAVSHLSVKSTEEDAASILVETIGSQIKSATGSEFYPTVIAWNPCDANRVTPVPSGHWILLQNEAPFRATLEFSHCASQRKTVHMQSIQAGGLHVACLSPLRSAGSASLRFERQGSNGESIDASFIFLNGEDLTATELAEDGKDGLALLTNGCGGMARMCVDLGQVKSKYDCVLGANLHSSFPVDRHVFAKRIRVWLTADGFISPLNADNLIEFQSGPSARWRFASHAGDGRVVEITLNAHMLHDRNTTVFEFSRPIEPEKGHHCLPPESDVRLTVRLDIEDRNFHWETKRNDSAEHHFSAHTVENAEGNGFQFTPEKDHQLKVWSTTGQYHDGPEWSEALPHPVEESRGQTASGDGYSPGWFEIPIKPGAIVSLFVSADNTSQQTIEAETAQARGDEPDTSPPETSVDHFSRRLAQAAQAYVVRRDEGKTVIAGYPWFLDWGRDSLIAARGLLVGGLTETVKDLAIVFARFEKDGTLPNTIHGSDATNRDTSDAPLWFGIVCEELASKLGAEFYKTVVGPDQRTILDVLKSIAGNYAKGTSNGIRMDEEFALIWSPSHFTWMDTNHPAGTPREGYPVEIQALWIRLLRQLSTLTSGTDQKQWEKLAGQAIASVDDLFWSEKSGWFADVLLGSKETPADKATRDDSLRSNCIALVSLGLVSGVKARRCVEAVRRYLVVPGALRSLAPLPVSVPLPIHGNHGGLLNDPGNPYWGRYEGDEDTRRKPAYHNGTAWTWTFPMFCEALALAWDNEKSAREAARDYLSSMAGLLNTGCMGHIPEVLDGDAPHLQRGCDAQAWGVTEAIRVNQWLNDSIR